MTVFIYGLREGVNYGGVTPTIEKRNIIRTRNDTAMMRSIVPDCTCTSAPSCVDVRRYGDNPVNRNRSYSPSSKVERSAVIYRKKIKKQVMLGQ